MHNWYTTFDTRFGISVKNRIKWVIFIFDLSLMKKKISKKRILQKIWPLLYIYFPVEAKMISVGGLEFLGASKGAIIAAASVAIGFSSSLLAIALLTHHFNSNT